MFGSATQDRQIRQSVDEVAGFKLAINPNGETLMRELIGDIQPMRSSPVMSAVFDRII